MDKRIGDVRHFKLASGDEVICEVIEWKTHTVMTQLVKKKS